MNENQISESDDSRLRIFGVMPGAIMYHAPLPEDLGPVNSERANQVRCLDESAAFATLDPEERNAVTHSLANSIRRADYHHRRFARVRERLRSHAARVPGELFWDACMTHLYFEAAALCGAARLIVDEVLYIGARRHGATPAKAVQKPWLAGTALSTTAPNWLRAVPEVARLRAHDPWYRTLNAYRNAFYHNGWMHGSGHAEANTSGSAAGMPSRNGLLVPDQGSLVYGSKPFQWTWNDGTSVDDVVARVHGGLHDLLRELCEDDWAAPNHPPGSLPPEQHPNMIVTLVRPVLLHNDDVGFVPTFSSREAAAAFEPFCSHGGFEVVEVPIVSSVTGDLGFSFWLGDLSAEPALHSLRGICVVLDPKPKDSGWRKIDACAGAEIEMKRLLEANPIDPITVPVGEDVTRVYLWRAKAEDQGWSPALRTT